MVAKSKRTPLRAGMRTRTFTPTDPLLTYSLPEPEEIARAIWHRQHSTLLPDAISYNVKWRDLSIPPKYWDEFLLDAKAVLELLHQKREKQRKFAGTK
jgi:hypothetical protein